MPRPRKKFETDVEEALNASLPSDSEVMPDVAPHKVSFVFPHSLVKRLDRIAQEQTVGDRSVIVRKILSDHIEEYEGAAPNKISVTLPAEMIRGLDAVHELTGKDRVAAMQDVVGRCLASYLGELRKANQELREQLSQQGK